MPSMAFRAATRLFSRSVMTPRLSEKFSGVISTMTSRVSELFTRSTMIW